MSKLNLQENYKHYRGEIEIIVRDKAGRIVEVIRQNNLVKVFAKEMLAHRLPYSKVWDPDGASGAGEWVDNDIDPDEEFSAKYILLGASYDDATGQPLDTADERYYTQDSGTNTYVPVKPNVGADNGGDLIHPIPISEPYRPLKRIERVYFEASYQPADSPLLDDSVRAINNVLVLETTLRSDEYNGFGTTPADFFTITEVALAGGRAISDSVGACECPPQYLFLEGLGGSRTQPIPCTASGSATISIDSEVGTDDLDLIKEGDQVFIIEADGDSGTEEYANLGQNQPYYLVTAKANGGRDITLDRTPTGTTGEITGAIGVFRSSLRLFSQRVLNVPFKKSSDFEITIRWLIHFN